MEIAEFFSHIWQAITLFFENVNLTSLIKKHGDWFYTITFIWTFLEGETFVIFAGAAAAKGILDIKALLVVAWIGSYCGDQLYFYLGRRFGKAILKRFPDMGKGSKKVAQLIKKYDIAFILTYRFVYGLRNISSFAMGMSGLDWRKFSAWNLLAAFIWATAFSLGGYFFGEALGKSLGSTVEEVMIGLLAVLIVIFVAKYGWKKFQEAKEKKEKSAAR